MRISDVCTFLSAKIIQKCPIPFSASHQRKGKHPGFRSLIYCSVVVFNVMLKCYNIFNIYIFINAI